VYNAGAAPVEAFYRDAGVLLDFEITGGIPETTPRLMAALQPYIQAAAQQQGGRGAPSRQVAAEA
jgi:adenylate kinase